MKKYVKSVTDAMKVYGEKYTKVWNYGVKMDEAKKKK